MPGEHLERRVPKDGVLVRFGEIGIKSPPVRSAMLQRLRTNILDTMERLGVEGSVERKGARIWMTGPETDGLVHAASRTFGVVSASPCRKVVGTLAAVCAASAELALEEPDWTRFAVRARREGKHPFSSRDVGIQAGSAVYEAMESAGRDVQVDLTDPELEVHVDIRQDHAYVFTKTVAGPGGLPLGAQGKALVLLSDQASAVAAWLMMRRGAWVTALHAGDSGSLPLGLVETLATWGMPNDVEVLPVCSGTTTKEALFEAAARVAGEREASVLVTGETLESSLCTASIPVLRPVCGLDPETYARFVGTAGIGDEAGGAPLGPSTETADSLLSMRRTVSV